MTARPLRSVLLAALLLAVAPGAVRAQDERPAEGEGEPAEDEVAGGEGEAADGEAVEGEGEPTGGEGEPAEAPPVDDRLRAVVVDAAPYGVDPVVGRHVTQRMRTTAEALGYAVVSAEATVAAAQRLRMPYPPAPADLWRVTYVGEAHRGTFARVWAHQGQYVIEITVASLDGTGPFFARGTSGAQDLHEVVERLTREALPPPERFDREAHARVGEQAAAPPPATGPAPPGPAPGFPPQDDPFADVPVSRPERRDVGRRFSLAVQTEGAIGTSNDTFYNHLFGVRLDYRVSREIILGVYGGYANLRGKNGRSSNLLMYAQLEDRIRISSRSDITVPLRFGLGYLPYNGPYVRLAAGLNVPLGERVELGFDILTPTFWVLPDRTAVSLDLAAELILRL